jgi:Outer membrane protein beta-barrel domain
MQLNSTFVTILALALCAACSQPAQAQDDRGAYFGGMLGTFDYEENGPEELTISDSTTAYQIFGGYRVNEHFAAELGIGKTGDIEDTFDDDLPPIGTVTLESELTLDIYTLRALGILPLDQFSLFAGIGYFSASFGGPVDLPGFGTVGEFDGHESGSHAVLGIQRDFSLDLRNLSIRGQYEWFDMDSEVDTSGLSVGVVMRF